LKFIKNLNACNVDSVFVSIPNMDSLYASRNISILHNEHTYFIGDYEVKFMFSQFGYRCAASFDFRTHSRFYYFVRDVTIPPLHLVPIFGKGSVFYDIQMNFMTKIRDISVNHKCFICPAGHYGQKIYYYLRKNQIKIEGFIDNDSQKQGLRVYGTPLTVYSADRLIEYTREPICIILYAGPYKDELKRQLNQLHPAIEYILA